jgi:hypothetical protein
MITSTGTGLNVLIVTEANQEWQTFATWYSIFKTLPNAKVVIACIRTNDTPYHYFQWCKRLNIKIFYQKPFSENNEATQLSVVLEAISHNLLGDVNLVIPVMTMAIDVIAEDFVNQINSTDCFFWTTESVWLMKNISKTTVEEMINECVLDNKKLSEKGSPIPLVKEAKDTKEVWPLVTYGKGCGRWINTLKGCPLSNAGGLISDDMTVNENRVFELWRKMVALFSAVAY